METDLKSLLSQLEKANKSESKVWKPEVGEFYYWINANGNICNNAWDDNNENCKKRYELGNYFKTRKEAEFALERQKVITELKRYALEHNEEEMNWENTAGKYKYYIKYDVANHDVMYDCEKFYKRTNIHFSSPEIALAAIIAIGKDRIKKYYFEVND